ncbi:MAG: hypothetical protein JXX14_03685 [Deltaproteobacteria bacterium]|nr:hypothetical protein [Deltaproteobacteria bacterium]
MDGWLTRSKEIEAALQNIAVEKDWLRGLNAHMMKRGRRVSEMVAAEKRYF